MNAAQLRIYKAQRSQGFGASYALHTAKARLAGPRHSFLADLDTVNSEVSDTIGGLTVKAWVEDDYDLRLGYDDVTGYFTHDPDADTVANTARGPRGNGYKYYHPSSYTLTDAYADYRRGGMSRSVARDAVRARVQREMHEDADRQYYGVVVSARLGDRELARTSLWGIDIGSDDGAAQYLVDTADELTDEVVREAHAAIPGVLASTLAGASALVELLRDEASA